MKKIFFSAFILFTHFGFAQNVKYDEVLNYYNTNSNFNGVALVATNGKIDYLNAVGVSNRQSGTMFNTKSKFKIASITKTFTAVMIMQLYEQGKIDLTMPFGLYYPKYAGEAKNKVTILNLLTYSSGIPNTSEKVGMESFQLPLSIDQYIEKYCSDDLENEPGTISNYSNTEYIILHKILEIITEKSYVSLLKENILDPLKMTNTNSLNSKDIVIGLTNSYTIKDSTKQVSSDEPYFIENFYGAGAMYSTVEDLLKFDYGIFNFKILNKENSNRLIAPDKKLDNVAFGVWYADGYGVFSKPFIYRTGGILGSCSNWIHSIEDKKSIILFNNTDGTNLYEMSEQLYLVSNGQSSTIPKSALSQNSNDFDFEKIKGSWVIDLRPTPTSEPYLKDFVITPTIGREFSGEFYDTPFNIGVFNTDWENIYFAFSTGDRDNTYFHSGYIKGDEMIGVSYSESRKFTSHWTGTKRKLTE